MKKEFRDIDGDKLILTTRENIILFEMLDEEGFEDQARMFDLATAKEIAEWILGL